MKMTPTKRLRNRKEPIMMKEMKKMEGSTRLLLRFGPFSMSVASIA